MEHRLIWGLFHALYSLTYVPQDTRAHDIILGEGEAVDAVITRQIP